MADERRYLFGDCEFSTGTFQLVRGGHPQPLEPKALDVLHLLLLRTPLVVTKAEIFAAVWKDVAVSDNTLTRVITLLRKALDDDARQPRYIATVSTRGYRWLAPVTVVDDVPAARTEVEPPLLSVKDPPTSAPRTPFGFRQRLAIGIAAVVALMAVAVVLYAARRTPRSTASAATLDLAVAASLKPSELTQSKGYDGHLSFSPDGTTIAYSSDRSGAMEIYVRSFAEGSTAQRLTSNGRQNVQPAWSPDGQFIAFHEMAGGGLWVVASRGGVTRKVAEFGSRPGWSPDGRQLIFHSASVPDLNPGALGATSTVWTVSVDGPSSPVQLTRVGDPIGSHGMPAWWPDGQHIVFAVQPPGGPDVTPALWVMRSDGGGLHQLTTATKVISSQFAVSPDGRGIYLGAADGHAIWWLPVDDIEGVAGDPRPTGLPVTGAGISSLAISRDRRRIGWTAGDPRASIWAVGERGSDATPLVPTGEVGWRAGFPVVAADGRVAFLGSRTRGHNQVFLAVAGQEPRQLTTDGPDHGGPVWLNHDRKIAVIADHGDGPSYWALDPESGREERLFRLRDLVKPEGVQSQVTGPAGGLALGPDTRHVAVAFVRDGVPNIWTASIAPDGAVSPFVQRTFDPEGASYPFWSPDGEWLAYECNHGADVNVCAVGPDAAAVQLTKGAGHDFIGGWLPDNRQLLFAARRDGVWNIARVSRHAPGVVDAMTTFTEPRFYVRYPRWDPAHQRVVFERFETTGHVWSVELPTEQHE